MITSNDFDAIQISLASPTQIEEWSHGEVLKPETINYRTQKPERGGLFCERIFGPVKDWECSCGKYKGIRYKGIVCDKCGVEVTRSAVRRDRMGHIKLIAPVAHIWFVRGTPNYLALLLNVTPRSLERVLYYAQYMVTELDEEGVQKAIEKLDANIQEKEEELKNNILQGQEKAEAEFQAAIIALKEDKDIDEREREEKKVVIERDLIVKGKQLKKEADKELEKYLKQVERLKKELKEIHLFKIISESVYYDLKSEFPDLFEAKMGAEAVKEAAHSLDVESLLVEVEKEIEETGSKQKKKKAVKRLRILKGIHEAKSDPSHMILEHLPVIPPDLRPMVQLDGGRFAASDLNDLYRRVINRNNRLKRLVELGAPEVITRNEKRMLQEAVDALLDNSAHGEKVIARKNRKLKSLSDILKGKQGRFRQNLLGKRVDYSGRAVIVVGPELRLHECGLPKKMALELFRPFVLRELLKRDLAHTIKAANRMIEHQQAEVWDVLEEVIQGYPVLLNRAPTLHRLGIQAFIPRLVEGSAIRIHPLVCTAFNADFDGDQMAVHVPLSETAKEEARKIMLASTNLLLPASGQAAVGPARDMLLGLYYMTLDRKGEKGEGLLFGSTEEALLAQAMKEITLHSKIRVRIGGEVMETTVGRIIFNQMLPESFGFQNQVMTKKTLGQLVEQSFIEHGIERTAQLVDSMKDVGFEYATQSAATISVDEMQIPEKKVSILEKAEKQSDIIQEQYVEGLITEDERYEHTVDLWMKATDDVTQAMMEGMDKESSMSMLITSGARGNIEQLRQMAGMRGLMADPSGKIIDLPIKSNFREGLTVLEYFISTHGTRKGRADTALRTADSGYLTRRMVDVSQNVIVKEKDCETQKSVRVELQGNNYKGTEERLVGRHLALPVADPKTGEVIGDRNDEITEEMVERAVKAQVDVVYMRSVLHCESRFGICQLCYGQDLAKGTLVSLGESVGIVAAQAIGEPGTQLTMRTFHAGGIAGSDITQGLPRVEELFEARTPKGESPIASVDGNVEIFQDGHVRKVRITSLETRQEIFKLTEKAQSQVESGAKVKEGDTLIKEGRKKVNAPFAGKVKLSQDTLTLEASEREYVEHIVPHNARFRVEHGQLVDKGTQLIEGSVNLQNLLKLMGVEAVQEYLVNEVQTIYKSQGVATNDKHIEIIVRRMLSRVKVTEGGDTEYLPGDLVNRFKFDRENEDLVAAGKRPAEATPVIMGITKAALTSGSFLSAASFQETIRVLTRAALFAMEDRLVGLKENLIIGKLIPAGPYSRKANEGEAASVL